MSMISRSSFINFTKWAVWLYPLVLACCSRQRSSPQHQRTLWFNRLRCLSFWASLIFSTDNGVGRRTSLFYLFLNKLANLIAMNMCITFINVNYPQINNKISLKPMNIEKKKRLLKTQGIATSSIFVLAAINEIVETWMCRTRVANHYINFPKQVRICTITKMIRILEPKIPRSFKDRIDERSSNEHGNNTFATSYIGVDAIEISLLFVVGCATFASLKPRLGPYESWMSFVRVASDSILVKVVLLRTKVKLLDHKK
ncbi:hypothetical protein BD770DRAFT_409076 [Pilaira anomala]|nr:hypothetical protein BD770DRAFT_409076 [Pilaira anomala]